MTSENKPFVVESKVHADDRGVFIPWLSNADSLSFAPHQKIKRVYSVINSTSGIIRGFHFHKEEWKIFFIVQGAAKFVAINPDKPKEVFTFISSSRKPNVIVIPPYYANGWMSLDDHTILICGSTSSFEESVQDDSRMDPYLFGDVWTVKAR